MGGGIEIYASFKDDTVKYAEDATWSFSSEAIGKPIFLMSEEERFLC